MIGTSWGKEIRMHIRNVNDEGNICCSIPRYPVHWVCHIFCSLNCIHHISGLQREVRSFLTTMNKAKIISEVTTMVRMLKHVLHSSQDIYVLNWSSPSTFSCHFVCFLLMLIPLVFPTEGFPSGTFDLDVALATRKTTIERSHLLVD